MGLRGASDVSHPARVVEPQGAMGSLDSYLPIFVLLVLGVLFAALSIGVSRLLGPRRPHAAKGAPYECGIVPTNELPRRFPVRFYLIAMIFVIFDIEIIFLFPWAVIYDQLGRFGLVEVIVFAGAVFVSFIYLVADGALDWGPARRARSLGSEPGRTSESAVRRVGSAGGRAE
jgi:NADH-quinone oxidoreductase subunit A